MMAVDLCLLPEKRNGALGPNGDGTIAYSGRIRDVGSSVRDEAGE